MVCSLHHRSSLVVGLCPLVIIAGLRRRHTPNAFRLFVGHWIRQQGATSTSAPTIPLALGSAPSLTSSLTLDGADIYLDGYDRDLQPNEQGLLRVLREYPETGAQAPPSHSPLSHHRPGPGPWRRPLPIPPHHPTQRPRHLRGLHARGNHLHLGMLGNAHRQPTLPHPATPVLRRRRRPLQLAPCRCPRLRPGRRQLHHLPGPLPQRLALPRPHSQRRNLHPNRLG